MLEWQLLKRELPATAYRNEETIDLDDSQGSYFASAYTYPARLSAWAFHYAVQRRSLRLKQNPLLGSRNELIKRSLAVIKNVRALGKFSRSVIHEICIRVITSTLPIGALNTRCQEKTLCRYFFSFPMFAGYPCLAPLLKLLKVVLSFVGLTCMARERKAEREKLHLKAV